MTEPLSPAAQAVFSAWAKPVDVDRSLVISGQALEAQARGALAAALRAAADQLGYHRAPGVDLEDLYGRIVEVGDLLAIAAELERV
jgi:hypothetical protein